MTSYKTSQFTVAKKLDEHGLATHVLVFNTRSGQAVLMESEKWDAVGLALYSQLPPPGSVAEAIEALANGGILIEREFDERRDYEAGFDSRRYDATTIFPIFAVTTSCNIGCTYCYEEGVVGEKMNDEVVGGVLRWLERRITLDGTRRIFPSLFGGEPLMHPRVLFALMDGLAELARRHDVEYAFTSSSNGILLTGDLAEALAARGLNQIQISLDGDQDHHDERRVGRRGQPSFERSLEGIRNAVGRIPNVTVKINFDRHNRSSVTALYDFLLDEGLGAEVDVKLETIAYQIGSSTAHNPANVIPPQAPELADAYLELMIEARRRGLQVNRETAHTTPCMFSSQHGVIVGPDGSIYKCISLVGRKDLRVATVFDDDLVGDEHERQMDTTKRTSECWEEGCPYIPVCAGGCAYESIVRTGRYDTRFCTKPYLEAWHYKKYLLRYQKRLEAAGAHPLTPERLRTTALPAQPVVAGCESGCGSGAAAMPSQLLAIEPMGAPRE